MSNIVFRKISSKLLLHQKSFYCKINNNFISSFALVYEECGEPLSVLQYKDVSQSIKSPKGNQILIQHLASPINPVDINVIQGVYSFKPKLPAVGGGEGVAKVIQVGDQVKNLAIGDWVVPAMHKYGTWATHSIIDTNDVVKIDNSIDVLCAAQLTVNPSTAYRMLKDFVDLKQGTCICKLYYFYEYFLPLGDSIIQNGANSAVGLYVIQLAKHFGVKTINVVRNRPELDELKQRLQSYGADVILTEEELRKKDLMGNVFNNISRPKLALNCVGGKNATDCLRHLNLKGTMVTYGAMSRQPLTIPAGALIFNDQRFFGFSIGAWFRENNANGKQSELLSHLCDLFKQGTIKPPETIQLKLQDYKQAVSLPEFQNAKRIFVLN